MKFYFFILLTLFSITGSLAQSNTILLAQTPYPGDTLSPFRVVEKYVSPNGFPEKLRHFCCEMYQEWMAKQTLGEQLAPTVQRECHLLYQDTAKAVVTVWLHDSTTSMDVYFYLQHRQVWTVYAVRSLTMKEYAKDELKRLDSVALTARGKSYEKSNGHSWQFDHDNAMLWGSSDTLLAQHFYNNRKYFESLEKMRAKKLPLSSNDTISRTLTSNKKMRKLENKLRIRNILSDKHAPGIALYFIGGMLDNSVGYFYEPDPAKVPAISAGYFILIRPLGNGWYLYKTT